MCEVTKAYFMGIPTSTNDILQSHLDSLILLMYSPPTIITVDN